MTIEYDDEDRCIRVDGEPISYGVAVGLLEQIEQAIDEWDLTTLPNATTRTDTTTTKRILTNRPAQVGPKTKTKTSIGI